MTGSWQKYAVPSFLLTVLLVHAFHIFSTAYLNINGSYTWRQADVLSHILGFLPGSGFAPFERFVLGDFQVYDIPIYQWIVAKVAYLYDASPLLVARIFNYLLLMICLAAIARMLDHLASRTATLVFLFLSMFSPLLLHYFSGPLPDLMAMAMAALGTMIILMPNPSSKALVVAILSLHLATLIKSPVPFCFVVFSAVFLSLKSPRALFGKTGVILVSLLPTALLAEHLRSLLLDRPSGLLVLDPSWYFGSLGQRLSVELWVVMVERTAEWLQTGYLPLFLLTLVLSTLSPAGQRLKPLYAAFVASFFANWLIFSNVNLIHNYYQLSSCLLGLAALAAAISVLIERGSNAASRLPILATTLTALVPLFLLPQIGGGTLSDKNPNTIIAPLAEALVEETAFVIVGQTMVSPTFAGAVQTRYKDATHDAFEAECESYLATYRAVLVLGRSDCLSARKSEFDTYIERPGILFIRQR